MKQLEPGAVYFAEAVVLYQSETMNLNCNTLRLPVDLFRFDAI